MFQNQINVSKQIAGLQHGQRLIAWDNRIRITDCVKNSTMPTSPGFQTLPPDSDPSHALQPIKASHVLAPAALDLFWSPPQRHQKPKALFFNRWWKFPTWFKLLYFTALSFLSLFFFSFLFLKNPLKNNEFSWKGSCFETLVFWGNLVNLAIWRNGLVADCLIKVIWDWVLEMLQASTEIF